MGIDVFVILILILAIYKGWQKGLVVGVFSFVGLVVGAAAALKFSGIAADYMADHFPSLGKWIPFLSFLLIFVVAVVLIRLAAAFIEKTMELSMMGWANKLGGVFFFSLLYLVVASILLFYANKLGMLPEATRQESKTYPFMSNLAPVIMDGLGVIIPFFKDMFTSLENVFEEMASKAQ